MIGRAATGVALAAVLAWPVGSQDALLTYPAAQCAALALGRQDYATASPFLDADPADPVAARAFRDAAIRLNGGREGEVDAFIAAQRPLMFDLLDAYIVGNDRLSRDLYERLTKTCADLAASQADTRPPP